ncbi:Glu/Leu/Phe/Val dehydrogenase dimerization domain-containing protein [Denitrobaculum tricleocarpae]|uniref:Glu/Leu/Phe/Val dehydrogenase n=1 Tax=Denitrobaculum tricleocarpae TaxID=2591009 RepID=A0A545TXU7_9PROT|nr:Glu/Leu/Phe/Val dehydrogenase dimerization domain-containing protein [Denitrobaculum tricleocarpae]TQV82043.1 Glu/Leu/Phe/Val dehydrogenase [Denitrobaculum tricleocarpae]
MTPFSHPEFDGHEEIAFCNDTESGLKAIIAIHNTNRGPALGGCRMWPYESDDEALTDALRLSRGMTYKSALAGLDMGGGKSVIIGDAKTMKSEALFRAMGRFVDSLGGRYSIAEDVGISVADVQTMAQETEFVAGTPERGAGDPSPSTAYGVYMGIRAAVAQRLNRASVSGITVAVQGLGSVGWNLCKYLADDGAKLIVTDIDQVAVARAVKSFGAVAVAPDAIYGVEADVFAPCALGAVINDETLKVLQTPIVAGSSNNQLAEPRHGTELHKRGILYAPDYVINAGGVINISHEGPAYDQERAFAHVAKIHDTLTEIFKRSAASGVPTFQAADRLAEERFQRVSLASSAA